MALPGVPGIGVGWAVVGSAVVGSAVVVASDAIYLSCGQGSSPPPTSNEEIILALSPTLYCVGSGSSFKPAVSVKQLATIPRFTVTAQVPELESIAQEFAVTGAGGVLIVNSVGLDIGFVLSVLIASALKVYSDSGVSPE